MAVSTTNQDIIHLLLSGIADPSALSVTLAGLEAGVSAALAAVAVGSSSPLSVVKALKPSDADVLAACLKTRASRGLLFVGGFTHTHIPQIRVRTVPSSIDVAKVDPLILMALREF